MERFYDNGAQIVFELNIDGKITDLPYVDHFFPEVDIDDKKVYVNIPEGL